MKCVGHFGSVRADGTQRWCSLKDECDRASLPATRRVLTQTEGGGKAWRGADGEEKKPNGGQGWGREVKRDGERAESEGSRGEMRRRTSLGLGTGRFNDRAHSTPPS